MMKIPESWEAGKDAIETFIPESITKYADYAEATYNYGAAAYDYGYGLIADDEGAKEDAKEHLGDALWATGGSIPIPGVNKAVHTAKTLWDTGKAMGVGHKPEDVPENGLTGTPDYAGMGAGLGLMLGAGSPLFMLAGGAIGTALTPKADHIGLSGAVGNSLGKAALDSMQSSALTNPDCIPCTENAPAVPETTKAMHLKGHPFGHYAD